MKYSEWKTYKLNQIGEVVSGGTPSTKVPQYWYGEIPWITPKDLSRYNKKMIYSGDRSITNDGLENSSVRLIPKNSILFSSRAPIGYVAKAGVELGTNQGFKNLVVNKNHCHDYIYYLLINETENIKRISGGSTFSEISGTAFGNFKVKVPEKKIQKKIAKILSSLDDKIELNNKINDNLEELAQTLYKHWFVDFEFPNEEGLPYKSSGGKMVESELGLIPEGWSVIKLNDIMDYSNGYAFKSKDYEETGKYKVITIRNVKDGKFDLSNVSKVHKIPERIREDQILIIGDILMSLTGKVGRVAIVDEDNCLLNQRVAKISSLDSNYKGFIYFILRNNEIFNKIVSLGKGSAQQNLSPIEMLKIKMTLPKSVDNIVLNKFNTMFNILIHNEIENKKLTKLRDLLLPKLMSGEIRVPIKE